MKKKIYNLKSTLVEVEMKGENTIRRKVDGWVGENKLPKSTYIPLYVGNFQ